MTGRPARWSVAVGAAVLLAGCGGGPASSPQSAQPPGSADSAGSDEPPGPADSAGPAESAGGSGFPGLPPRPAELPLTGVAPCGLLTSAQLEAMKVPPRTATENTGADRFGSAGCQWGTANRPPYGAPLIRLVTAQGIGYFGYMLDRGQISDIDGFPTVRDIPEGRPDETCVLFVDVAQGQTLRVEYNKLLAEPGTINREQACARARELGQAVIATLRARPGR